MYEWEYKTIKFFAQGWSASGGKINHIELEEILNELGARGWELVTIVPGAGRDGELWDYVAVFKREVNP